MNQFHRVKHKWCCCCCALLIKPWKCGVKTTGSDELCSNLQSAKRMVALKMFERMAFVSSGDLIRGLNSVGGAQTLYCVSEFQSL